MSRKKSIHSQKSVHCQFANSFDLSDVYCSIIGPSREGCRSWSSCWPLCCRRSRTKTSRGFLKWWYPTTIGFPWFSYQKLIILGVWEPPFLGNTQMSLAILCDLFENGFLWPFRIPFSDLQLKGDRMVALLPLKTLKASKAYCCDIQPLKQTVENRWKS